MVTRLFARWSLMDSCPVVAVAAHQIRGSFVPCGLILFHLRGALLRICRLQLANTCNAFPLLPLVITITLQLQWTATCLPLHCSCCHCAPMLSARRLCLSLPIGAGTLKATYHLHDFILFLACVVVTFLVFVIDSCFIVSMTFLIMAVL